MEFRFQNSSSQAKNMDSSLDASVLLEEVKQKYAEFLMIEDDKSVDATFWACVGG